jgi:hypothetical protein
MNPWLLAQKDCIIYLIQSPFLQLINLIISIWDVRVVVPENQMAVKAMVAAVRADVTD